MSPSFAPGAALVNRSRSAPNGGDTVDEDRTTSRDPEGGAER
jgi:hypothetical protein